MVNVITNSWPLNYSTNEYRNAFLRTIRQIIRDDVRRMSILGERPAISARSETSPTATVGKKDKHERKHMVSFASTQNLARCDYCGEDFSKMMKQQAG